MTAQPKSPTKKSVKVSSPKKPTAEKTTDAAKPPVANTKPQTDEEKRLAKNAYVAAWRKAHPDKVKASMDRYKAKRAKASGKTSTKKTTSKREKKSPSADATQPTPAAAVGESAA